MHEGDVAAVDDAVAGHPRAQAEVDVFQAVAVPLVEAAELLEHVAPDDQAGPRHAVELVGAAGGRKHSVLMMEDVLWHDAERVAQEPDPGVLDRAVLEQQPRAGNRHAGLGDLRHQRLERARHHLGVVVEEDQHVAASARGAGVAAPGEVEVVLEEQDLGAVGPLAQKGGRVVRRGVVDEDELPAAPELLAERAGQGIQAALGHGTLAVGDDDDGCFDAHVWGEGGERGIDGCRTQPRCPLDDRRIGARG